MVIDKRRMSRKTGGHVEMWPEVKRWGHLPRGGKISEHLQTGPQGGCVLKKQTQL